MRISRALLIIVCAIAWACEGQKPSAQGSGSARDNAAAPTPAPSEAEVEPKQTEPKQTEPKPTEPEPAAPEPTTDGPVPTIDTFTAELTSEDSSTTLEVEVALSNVTAEMSPVVLAVCGDGEHERVAFVEVLDNDEGKQSMSERMLLPGTPTRCSVRVALAPARIVDERCLEGSQLSPGPCSPAFAQLAPAQPLANGSVVAAGAPTWIPYTGARPHGADVLVDLDLTLTHALAGLGELQAFAKCDEQPEEELLDQDAPIASIDDLSWVAPGQRVHVRGATVAYLRSKGEACSVRVSAKPLEPGTAPVTLAMWCLGKDGAKPGAC